jgi:hypothetical protein
MPKKCFYPLIFLLLAFPAIVHAFVLYSHGTLDWGHVDKNFLYNYLWMALPHFITVVLMLFKFASKPFTLINLIVLNIAMLIFQLMLLNERDAALVWGLLYPWLFGVCFILSYVLKKLFKTKE